LTKRRTLTGRSESERFRATDMSAQEIDILLKVVVAGVLGYAVA
jgi:hypothetical protein